MNYLFDTNAVIYFLEGKGKYPEFSDEDISVHGLLLGIGDRIQG